MIMILESSRARCGALVDDVVVVSVLVVVYLVPVVVQTVVTDSIVGWQVLLVLS